MEEVIQNLVRQKIREVLKVCGISNGTDEQFKEEIVRISSTGELSQPCLLFVIADLTAVYKARVESGIEGDFECLPETNTPSTTACSNSKPSITLCRLCFLGSDMRKRKFDKLEGMTQPDKRKRRRSKKVNGSVEEPTGAVASKASALDRPREVAETGADAPPKTLATELRAAADQLSAGTAVAARSVDTLAGADKPSGDTEPITLADDIHSRCTSTSLARRDIGEGATNVGSLETPSDSASRDGVTGTSKGGALSAGQTSLVADISTPSSFAATERWRTVDRTQQLVPYPSPSLSGLLQPEDALRIMSSVLLHCAS
jgi:hypothetical protein